MAGQIITAERLRELLHYDPETGLFTRRIQTTNSVQVGDVAGHTGGRGYVIISLDGRKYYAHRLAWLYMTGEWPPNQIDHEDTNRTHNWWGNLRLATNAQNKQNMRNAQVNNKTGVLGVYIDGNRVRACIHIDRKIKHLGSFATIDQARSAYREAKAALHPFQTLVDAP